MSVESLLFTTSEFHTTTFYVQAQEVADEESSLDRCIEQIAGDGSNPRGMGRLGLRQRGSRFAMTRCRCDRRSEIRFVRDRNMKVVIREMRGVLGTGDFDHGLLPAPEIRRGRPRLPECGRIVNDHGDVERLAVRRRSPPLLNMQVIAVRCAVFVDKGPGIQADRIDHQRVAFVVADRLPVP